MGGSYFRVHPRTYGPVYYGRTGRSRFDDPRGQYGVLYTALDAYGAFIESFGQQTGVRTISSATLKSHCLTELYPRRPLILADLFNSCTLLATITSVALPRSSTGRPQYGNASMV